VLHLVSGARQEDSTEGAHLARVGGEQGEQWAEWGKEKYTSFMATEKNGSH
jgi:hypothetical protein